MSRLTLPGISTHFPSPGELSNGNVGWCLCHAERKLEGGCSAAARVWRRVFTKIKVEPFHRAPHLRARFMHPRMESLRGRNRVLRHKERLQCKKTMCLP